MIEETLFSITLKSFGDYNDIHIVFETHRTNNGCVGHVTLAKVIAASLRELG